jgi:hypothetical protein
MHILMIIFSYIVIVLIINFILTYKTITNAIIDRMHDILNKNRS